MLFPMKQMIPVVVVEGGTCGSTWIGFFCGDGTSERVRFSIGERHDWIICKYFNEKASPLSKEYST